jgi:hypothetical protein
MENVILINEEFSDEIFGQCQDSTTSVEIYCAFIKRATIERMGTLIDPSVNVSVVARWRVGDLFAGVSDLSVYEYCESMGWKFGIKLSLHAKVFIFDDRKVLLGSANTTESGFGLSNRSNDEVSAVFTPEVSDLGRLRMLENGVTWLDQELFEQISKFVGQNIDQNANVGISEWPNSVMAKLDRGSVGALWISELPQISFDEALSLGWSRTVLTNEFENSDLFKWLIQILSESTSDYTNFGWITRELHTVLLDEPGPNRKEVKDYVALIFDWIDKSEIDKIYIKKFRRTSSLNLQN